MSKEIAYRYSAAASNLYATVMNSAGQLYNALTPGFENIADANWTSTKYCRALTEQGTASQIYEGDFPALAAGVYRVDVYLRAGGSPAITDTLLGSGRIDWDGTAETAISSRTKPSDTQARVTLVDTVTTYTGNTPQTGDNYARLGTPAGASVSADIAAAKSDTAAIKAKTDNLPASPAAVGSAMTLASGAITAAVVATDAIDADALAADALTEIFTKVWTTALTEAYAADGAAPTPAQFMFMLWSFLTEFGISSTTYTAKKLDGTTTSMTFSLDSASAPTSIDRTT